MRMAADNAMVKNKIAISSIYMTALYEELIKIAKKCEKVVKKVMHLSS